MKPRKRISDASGGGDRGFADSLPEKTDSNIVWGLLVSSSGFWFVQFFVRRGKAVLVRRLPIRLAEERKG